MRVIAYIYEADHHCPECAVKKFGQELDSAVDFEGNEVTPLYDIEVYEDIFCGKCFKQIYDATI